jgi:hypothetical protein
MGVEYDYLGEECKSSKKEKGRKFVWVGDQNYSIHVFEWRAFFIWSFLSSHGVLSVEA